MGWFIEKPPVGGRGLGMVGGSSMLRVVIHNSLRAEKNAIAEKFRVDTAEN